MEQKEPLMIALKWCADYFGGLPLYAQCAMVIAAVAAVTILARNQLKKVDRDEAEFLANNQSRG